jgi:catechol 2,3-dioxygenase-like lactoylglutathione lyase family enzyme
MTIQGMNHFTVLTSDLEATRRFYGDLLVELDFSADEAARVA